MGGLATQQTNKSVSKFIASIENENRRKDSETLIQIMETITGHPPKIWGDNFIIGFGKYTYKRKSGKQTYQWFNLGFAPRKTKLTLYLTCDLEKHKNLLEKLGKYKHGKGCLHINKLSDVNLDILKQLIEQNKTPNWK